MTNDEKERAASTGYRDPRAREGGLALAGLLGLSVLQPLFGLLAKNPGFLTAHQLLEGRLIGFALFIGLGVPALLGAAYLTLRRLPPRLLLAHGVAAVLFGVMGAAFALQIIKRTSLDPSLTVGLAMLLGLAAAVGFWRIAELRQFAGLLALGLLVYPLVFLLNKDIKPLLRAAPAQDADLEDTLSPEVPKVPIVLVVLDELPVNTLMTVDEEIDTKRFPGFARLARSSTWYRRATAAAESTAKAIPGIVTGNLPRLDSEPVLAEYPDNLFRWLGANGYELVVTQNHTLLCPRRMCEKNRTSAPAPAGSLFSDLAVLYGYVLAPAAWVDRLPAVDQTWSGFRSARTRAASDTGPPAHSVPKTFERFLAQISTETRQSLYYLHLGVPHVPWKYLPSGREYGPLGKPVTPLGFSPPRWGSDEWVTTVAWQRHVLQTQYTDRLLSRLLDDLEARGLWSEALLIVTADHGTSFRPNLGRRVIEQPPGAGKPKNPRHIVYENLEDILEVPLFIKRPGQDAGAVSDYPSSTLDIVATVADVLGVEVPWPTGGTALSAEQPWGERTRYYHTGTGGLGTLEITTDNERRRAALERKERLLGSGDDSLFEISPHKNLLGAPVAPLVQGEAIPGLGYELADAWLYDNIDLDAHFLPAHVFATLTGPEDTLLEVQDQWFAVALGGVVRAVTRPILSARALRLSALLPEAVWKAGSNEVSIYQLVGGNALRPLSSEGPQQPVQLVVLGDTVQALEVAPGNRVPVDRNSVTGLIRLLDDRIDGSATRPTDGRAYDELFLFRGPELLYRGVAHRQQGPDGDQVGNFRLEMSTELLAERSNLRVFARVGDVASELRRFGEGPAKFSLLPARAGRNDRDRVQLELPDHTIIPTAPRRIVGNVDRIAVEEEVLVFEGWALYRTGDEPPREFRPSGLALLVNEVGYTGDYQSRSSPTAERAEAFRIELPLDRLDREGFWIRLFAVTHDGQAGELKHHGRRLTLVAREAVGWGEPEAAAD